MLEKALEGVAIAFPEFDDRFDAGGIFDLGFFRGFLGFLALGSGLEEDDFVTEFLKFELPGFQTIAQAGELLEIGVEIDFRLRRPLQFQDEVGGFHSFHKAFGEDAGNRQDAAFQFPLDEFRMALGEFS